MENYPKEILPQPDYIPVMNMKNLLLEYPGLAVSRRVDGNKEDAFIVFNGHSQLREDKIGQVLNMSLNLLGGLFDNGRHLCYHPRQDVRDWEGEEVRPDELDGKYEVTPSCFPVFLMAKDIFDYPFSVPYFFQKEKDALVFITSVPESDIERKYTDKFSKQEPVIIRTHAVLRHAPTNFNYWHCVLDSYPSLSATEEIKSADKNSLKRIVRMLRADLLQNFLKESLPVDYEIDSSFYRA